MTALDAHGGHDHHDHKARRDQESLPEVQESQRIGGLEGGALITFHRAVIAARLAGFGPEILDGLEIQQAVDGLLVGVGILIIHLAAQFHAPFGDRKGEPDIDRDGQHDHRQVPDVEQEKQDPRDHQQFQNQRPDREKQETQQEVHALHTAFDDPAEAPGLARQVIAHRQAMDMGEGFQRQRPERALPDGGEYRIAQLLKAVRKKPRHAIGHGQTHRAQHQRRHPFPRQRIHGLLVKDRRHHGDDLAHHQRQQRQNDAPLYPRLILGPQIGRDTPDRAPAGPAFGACLVRSGGRRSHGSGLS